MARAANVIPAIPATPEQNAAFSKAKFERAARPPQQLAVAIKPEPYPIDALPRAIGDAVREVQGFTKAPVSMVAASALSALSLVGQALVNVRRMPGLEGPVSLYMLTFGESGERKSTCDRQFTEPIEEWCRLRRQKDAREIARSAAEVEAWQAMCAGLRESMKANAKAGAEKRAEFEEARKALESALLQKPTPYLAGALTRGEDTPEKLARVMVDECPNLGVFAHEGGLMLGGHGLKPDSIMRTLSQDNVFWDGGAIQRGRMSERSDVEVRGGRLTKHIMVQESVFRAFNEGSNGLPRGSGYLARFLVSWPESTVGTRLITKAPDWRAMHAFKARIDELMQMIRPAMPLLPTVLELDESAFERVWRQYADHVERESASGHELHDVKDIAAKSADNAARLAALFHVFEHGADGPIGADCMRRGVQVAAWHLSEARRIFGSVAVPPDMVNASRLDEWLADYLRRGKPNDPPGAGLAFNEIPIKAVYQFGPRSMRSKAEVAAALNELDEQDRAWLGKKGRVSVIVVHPNLAMEATK
jgi:putative DNA primase/helicase